MKKLILLLTAVALILSIISCGKEDDDVSTDAGLGSEEDVPAGGDTLPGVFQPVIMVDGKLFTWTRLAVRHDFLEYDDGSIDVSIRGDGITFLPVGYTEAGEISGITTETPTENMQLMAGFEASGTVFTSETTPEVVYVLMSTEWIDSEYIRFVSDDLHDRESIFYNGQQYRISIGTGITQSIRELPEGCVSVGTLKYIGCDTVPSADLETNCDSDSYGKYLGGREVFADPDDLSKIYVYEQHYWAEGDYPAWLVCKPWND